MPCKTLFLYEGKRSVMDSRNGTRTEWIVKIHRDSSLRFLLITWRVSIIIAHEKLILQRNSCVFFCVCIYICVCVCIQVEYLCIFTSGNTMTRENKVLWAKKEFLSFFQKRNFTMNRFKFSFVKYLSCVIIYDIIVTCNYSAEKLSYIF